MPTSPLPISNPSTPPTPPPRSRSYASTSLAADLSDLSDSDTPTPLAASAPSHPSLSNRRQSVIAIGPRPTCVPGQLSDTASSQRPLTIRERQRQEERSLLKDNKLISTSETGRKKSAIGEMFGRVFSREDSGGVEADMERQPLLGPAPTASAAAAMGAADLSGQMPNGADESLQKQWEEAVAQGVIHTTWKREAKTLTRYARPLIASFLLQYSLTVTSVFTVGHLGKIPLGAVSLASMTSNITGWAIYQGLATSLDTLCAQAYGSGKHKLVGLQLQRMVLFLWAVTIPVAVIWLSADHILAAIVPERELAMLAGSYLKIAILGAPAYAFFESGKRFMQAQGLFAPTFQILLVCAPLNILLHWLFVWQFGWGFIGAPIAVAVTDNLLAIMLVLYIRFVDGMECWGGFSKKAWRNWGPMMKLALPGLLMVEAEFLAFEVLTLISAWFGTTALAAQSVLSTITAITFQIPFPLSVAASTRIANLIGATLTDAAKIAARVGLGAAFIVGCFNMILLLALREHIPKLFTSDEDVILLVKNTLPVVIAFQLFDALSALCSGILRGIGRQEVGGYVNLFCYYVVALPVSVGTGFGLGWELYGLWAGPAIALLLVFIIESIFIYRTDWEKSVEAAKLRNENE
ncbi:MAG: hypothetical protein M1814_006018 [Vezdaea aestivalis]|nr:MAG: hypothetical protein M1814_006018 [Vezdaea aestivalis]